jgi:hypothetical protein
MSAVFPTPASPPMNTSRPWELRTTTDRCSLSAATWSVRSSSLTGELVVTNGGCRGVTFPAASDDDLAGDSSTASFALRPMSTDDRPGGLTRLRGTEAANAGGGTDVSETETDARRAVSSSVTAASARPRACTSRCSVAGYGRVRAPRSRSAMPRALSPACSASSSWVRPTASRWRRSKSPNDPGSPVAVALTAPHPRFVSEWSGPTIVARASGRDSVRDSRASARALASAWVSASVAHGAARVFEPRFTRPLSRWLMLWPRGDSG